MTFHRHLAGTLLVVTALAVAAIGTAALGEEAVAPIVVVTSRDAGPYDSVVHGIRGQLSESAHGHPIVVHSLDQGAEDAERSLRRAREAGAPILTVGSLATRAALEAPGDAPVIACMVIDSRELREAKNATGVLLDFPLETQLKWTRRFVPKGHTIGVLYNPVENGEEIAAAKRIARRLGLNLVAREVRRPQDLPDALDDLAKEADLLWGVTDQLVLSRQTAEAILLFSYRNRIPFSGLSASWVKAGALYALDRDYEDLGAQCGEMAIDVLNGRPVSSLPPETPRKLVYSLNLRTAEHLKLDLSPEIVDRAQKVYR